MPLYICKCIHIIIGSDSYPKSTHIPPHASITQMLRFRSLHPKLTYWKPNLHLMLWSGGNSRKWGLIASRSLRVCVLEGYVGTLTFLHSPLVSWPPCGDQLFSAIFSHLTIGPKITEPNDYGLKSWAKINIHSYKLFISRILSQWWKANIVTLIFSTWIVINCKDQTLDIESWVRF